MTSADNTLVSVAALERYLAPCTAPEVEMACANIVIVAMRRIEADKDKWTREQHDYYSQFADEALRF